MRYRAVDLWRKTIPLLPTAPSLPSSMPITTRASNAERHPGLIVLDGQWTKRSKQQIKEDKARKKAAAIAARQLTEAKHHAVLLRLAESEAAVEQDEEDIRANTTRPDIRYEFLPASRLLVD
jgi:hypothetical protein